MGTESFFFGEVRDLICHAGQGVTGIIGVLGLLDKIVDREWAGKACCSAGRKRVVGTCEIITEGFWTITTHENRAGVMDGIEDNTVPVKSTKAYLTAVLFNSLSTLDHFYSIQAKTEYSTPIYAQPSHQCYQRDYDYEPGESL